jgi:hypothetical protein
VSMTGATTSAADGDRTGRPTPAPGTRRPSPAAARLIRHG